MQQGEHTDLRSLKEYTAGDRFKYLHRHEAGLERHYATDLDLVLVEKHPEPHVTGFLEFKNHTEPVRFTQAVLFGALKDVAPVFVVESRGDILADDPCDHRFTVKEFVQVVDLSTHPPDVEMRTVADDLSWGGLIDHETAMVWERERGGSGGLIEWEEALRNRQFAERDG